MRRTPFALLLLAPVLASAQHTTAPKEPKETALPVTRVSLYKNGVGFFEHTGAVTGNAAVTLSFTSAQLDDVLQSLTAIDLNGGRISGAGYNSTTPLDQQLKSLALGLGPKTTFSGLFTALRGTRVEVLGSGAPFTGRLVDIEMHKTGPGKEGTGMTEGRFLTVASDTGTVRIFQLTPFLSVRLLDTSAHTDLTQYLTLLDSTRNQGLRHLTLQDNGVGTRQLQLSYISEVPIWKSTYRILFTDPATKPGAPPSPTASSSARVGLPQKPASAPTATLQGWSVVDNTTGTDWINVHLSLIAGSPQSFIQPLSQPIYSRRPEIPIAQEAQLTPQTHDSSNQEQRTTLSVDQVEQISAAAAPMMQGKVASRSFLASGMAGGTGYGIGAGSGSNIGGGVFRPSAGTTTYEEAANKTFSATTAAFDDFFAYNLTEPVTIHKNESALVPILQAKIPADRVTLVSSNGTSTQQPLRALWITNTSGQTLDRGSFTLVENGNFGGEGLLDPIHPDEKRLLSYAADQAVHVSVEDLGSSTRINTISAAKGVLYITRRESDHITYVFHNSAAEPRSILLEHPVQRGLTVDPTPAPVETTASVIRYRIEAGPGKTERLHLTGHRASTTTFQLTNSDDNQLTYILNSADHNPALAAALQPILEARRHVSDAQAAVDQTTERLTALRSDEDRQRSNITALATADKSSRDRFVHDLNTTEDTIKSTQTELATRTSTLDAAKADLANRIESLQLNETL